MANEANITSGLNISKSNLQYRSYPTSFKADVAGSKGPSPGSITVDQNGTDVDLSEIGTPGFCRVMNQDSTYTIIVGLWNGSTLYPIIDLLPGEHYTVRLSEWFGEEFGTGTGTATTGTGNTLRVKSVSGNAETLVEVFDK